MQVINTSHINCGRPEPKNAKAGKFDPSIKGPGKSKVLGKDRDNCMYYPVKKGEVTGRDGAGA